MNIFEALEKGIKFEEKACLFYQQILSYEKEKPDSELLWREIVAQKEKQIALIKKNLLSVLRLKEDISRINLIPSREMEDALIWIDSLYKKSQEKDFCPTKIHEMIHTILSFELNTIYSPLFKIFDLQFIKEEPTWIPYLVKHLDSFNHYFKKNQLPLLSSLIEAHPFLNKKEVKKKTFKEETFLQSLISEKKSVTIQLINGKSISGQLMEFDHFSIRCLDSNSPTATLFMKESILSIRIHD